MSKLSFAAVALAATLVSGAVSASTAHYDSAWFFGDSLTDNGNLYAATGKTLPPSPPNYMGRRSNGPVWADHIGGDFAAKGLATHDYAYVGATAVGNADPVVPGLARQIANFKNDGNTLGAKPLAFIWIGANDAIQAIATNPTPTAVTTATANAVNAIGAGIQSLAAAGIRDFMLINMPPLNLTPAFAGGPAQPLAELATYSFNTYLDQQIANLSPFANIGLYDVHQSFLNVIANPAAYGITNVTTPCLLPSGDVICSPEEANRHLFWDVLHPSARIHAEIADEIRERVAPVPLPASLLLVVVGAAALGGVALRRRA